MLLLPKSFLLNIIRIFTETISSRHALTSSFQSSDQPHRCLDPKLSSDDESVLKLSGAPIKTDVVCQVKQ